MLSCANKAPAQNIKYLQWTGGPLDELYRCLSAELERVRGAQFAVDDSRLQVCLAVLSEDLEALLEQCENHLYLKHYVHAQDISQLHALSRTVLEDVSAVLPSMP